VSKTSRRELKRVGAVLSALLMVACGAEAPAQSVGAANHPIDEGGASALELTGTFPEAFGLVTNVRELDDRTLLVADPLSKVLLRIDMESGTADTIGSEGPGPDEYRQPDAIFALEGGGSFLVDLGNARFTVLDENHVFGQTYPLASGNPEQGGNFEMKLPEGVDLTGRVYYRGRLMNMGGDPPTTAPIRRWNPATDVTDELAEVALPATSVERSGGSNNQSVHISPIPLAPQDEWGVGADGRIAIARHAPFHLEWVDLDGTVTTGPEVSYDPVAINNPEKLEWQARRSESGGGLSVSVQNNNGAIRTTFSRGGPSQGDRPRIADMNWPEVKPPFESVIVASDGTAWVRRSREAGEAPLYDIFDAEGRRTGSIELEGGRRVISFTEGSVYVVSVDEFDLQHLERYRLPS